MIDLTIFEDITIKRLMVGIFAGLSLGMILEIVLAMLAGSAYKPVVFFGVLIMVLAVLVRWSNGLECGENNKNHDKNFRNYYRPEKLMKR